MFVPQGVFLVIVFGVNFAVFWVQINASSELFRTRRQISSEPQSEEGYCVLPPPLENGRFSPSRYRCPSHKSTPACQMIPGTLVPPNWPMFNACNFGYKLEGGKTASVCLDGQWKPPLPTCVVASCSLPPQPAFGHWEATNLCRPYEEGLNVCRNVPGSVVPNSWRLKYTCDQGYRLNSSYEYSVCENGVWNNSVNCVQEGCKLPSHPKYGAYSSLQCSASDPRRACRNTPGTYVDEDWVIKYKCNDGYSLNKDIELSFCENKRWKNELDCIIKQCPPLISLSVDIKCQYNGREVPCDRPMRPETKATVTCKQFYEAIYIPDYKNLYCLSNGEWTYPLFQCNPVCGVHKKQPTALEQHGNETQQGEFPWLAALYFLNSSQKWEQMCGGTLITRHIVLTAAHCLVNSDNEKVQPSELKVGLGKYYRDYYRDEPSSVISDVKEVVIRREYSGAATYYALDIGLLDLEISVQVTAFVMPACVDWSNSFKPAPNDLGVIAGWGQTEEGTQSDVILSVQLSYIGYEDCLKLIKGSFKGLLTHDKSCGKSTVNGASVSKGVRSGGLTFVMNNQHFIQGISSTKIPNENSFILFTDITNSEHITWLEKKKNQLKLAHQES